MILVPVATPVVASNAAEPMVTVSTGNPVAAGSTQDIVLTVSNPSSNQFTITGFVINAPATWTINDCNYGNFLDSESCSSTAVSWTVSVFFVGTGAGIPPGGSDDLEFLATPATASSYPFTSSFTSKVQDASSVAFYTGPSFNLQVVAPGTEVDTVTQSSTTYTAGSAPLTVTATIDPVQAGVPIVFSVPGSYGTSSPTAVTLSPVTVMTDATGTASTTFQPSNHAGDTVQVEADIGTSGLDDGLSSTITTVAGPPTSVTFGSPFNGAHYVTAHGLPTGKSGNHWAMVAGSTIAASLADKFGNPINLATVGPYTATITAVASGGLFDSGSATSASVTCTTGMACASGLTISYAYFQSGTYGSIGLLTASVVGTSPAFAAQGSSGNVITSTFDATPNVPTFKASTTIQGGTPSSCLPATPCQLAGKTVTLFYNTTVVQAGVPATFYLDTAASSAGYAGLFSNSAKAITVATGSKGGSSAVFTVDTKAGNFAEFFANFTRPTDGSHAGTTAHGGDSVPVTTLAGAASKISITAYFTNTGGVPSNLVGASAVGALTLWVTAQFSDAYGNAAVNPGPNQVQLTLSASGGVLSATTVYIPSGGSDTYSAFGLIAWTLPSGSGTKYTLTVTGVVSGTQVTGTYSVTTVSANPVLRVVSPTTSASVFYSTTPGVVFTGNANASLGYPPTVTISTVTYSVNKGTATAATIVTGAGTGKVTWSAGIFFSAGLNNITFTAKDSNSNTVTSSTFNVLVDSTGPTMKFITKTGTSLTFGSTVTATIFDTLGDLNATSVVATRNGTAIASANVAITGTNNLGKNTTYSVTISGLPSGTWILGLSGKDLAGNSGTATTITVTVTVPFAASVTINSATAGTLGSFSGITVSATNLWGSTQNLVVFAVWKNSAGQTVAVTTGGLTLAAGATGSAFAPLASPLPSGAYSVSVFVITTGNNPVSSTTSISVAV